MCQRIGNASARGEHHAFKRESHVQDERFKTNDTAERVDYDWAKKTINWRAKVGKQKERRAKQMKRGKTQDRVWDTAGENLNICIFWFLTERPGLMSPNIKPEHMPYVSTEKLCMAVV